MKKPFHSSIAIAASFTVARFLSSRSFGGICAAALLFVAAALPARAGVALKLFYDAGVGIPGNNVTNFTSDPSFPSGPTLFEVLASALTIAQNNGNNYGTWTRGFIEAPLTGTYTFWIASDDEGQLWLSSDENPSNLVQIAENAGAVNYLGYTAANQSGPISLVASHKYYFEMFHKQGLGATHCEVSWSLPDGSSESVLGANHLWPYPVDWAGDTFTNETKAPAILTSYAGTSVTSLQASTAIVNGRPVDLTITAEATQPATVQWYSNSVAIPGANLLNYHISRITPAHDSAVYSVIVSNSIGTDTTSTTISVIPDSTPPTLLDALILGNPAADVSAVFSEGIDPVTGGNPANYSLNNGATITSAVIGPDNATVLLRASGLTVGVSYTLTVNNVQDLAGNPIAANSSVAVEANLNTAFRFDETGGITASDASGNGNNGTLVNGVQPGFTGKVLRADKFDGAAGHVALPNGYSDFTAGMTVALWANPTTSLTSWARFIDLGNGAGSDNILFARNGTSANLTFEVRLGTPTAGQITANGVLALNQWQHFAVTMDASGNVIIYKNGVAVQTGTLTGVPNIVTRTNCYIGRSDFPQDGYFQGKLDDFRIYNRVLTPDAILALASGGGPDDLGVSVPAVTVVATTPTTAEKATPPGVFTVNRTGSTNSPLTVQYTLGGSASNGVNYTNLSGSVTIAAGATNAQILVGPIDLSFPDLSRTVVLTLTGSTNYTLGDANTDVVTIQNNDVVPAAFVATADNAHGVKATNSTIDVWFRAAVSLPSATNLANYALSGGLTVTNATLDASHKLRVILGVSSPVPTNTTLSVSGVMDAGGNTVPTNISVRVPLVPFNIVANIYHGAGNTRAAAFANTTDGIVNNVNNGGTGFDTFNGANTLTQFGGMIYPSAVDLQSIKVDLGQQFGDGGDWRAQPKVYILKNPVDTQSTRPESDTNDWVQVSVPIISGSAVFQNAGFTSPGPSPNTPYVFDLSGLTPAQRSGFGWAVGGAQANGANSFMSFSELRAYGAVSTNNPVAFALQPTNVTITAGQRGTFSARLGTNFLFVNYQWFQNGSPIPGATNGYYTTSQTTTGDSGSQFYVVATNVNLALTSSVATLTVNARTNPPVVVAATSDLFGNIDIWYDEPVDPGTAQSTGNYALNDPALSINGASQDAFQLRITLSYSGTPSVSNVTLTASGVMDTFGNTLGSQTVPVLALGWPVLNFVANQFHQGRAAMLTVMTNGILNFSSTANTANADTFGGALGLSDFVGLTYSQPQVFGIVKVDLGHQYVDGGDWSAQPTLYVLKSPVDTSQSPPESNTNWVAVPATLVSGNIFSWEIDAPVNSAPVNSPIAFDLSHLPLNQRAGYGWAVGGVPGNALATSKTGIAPANEFLSISELRAFGQPASTVTNVAGAPQIILDLQPRSLTYPCGFPLTYAVYVTGTQPISFQWKFNGTNLTDNGRITGSHSIVLNIAEVLAGDAGTYQLFMTNGVGNNASAVATLAVTRPALNSGDGWTQNGGAVINTNLLTLTDGATGEARSSFLNYPEYIGAFKASWTYQDVGSGGADGGAFVLQNDPRGPSALGPGGGTLAYSGITPSVALEWNIYGPNIPGIALRNNGATGTPYSPTTPVNIASGNPIGVALNYDGTTLSLTLTDTVAHVSFSSNIVINLPSLVGTNSAYVGLTGASGGAASKQTVSNFSFVSLPNLAVQPVGNSFVFTWPGTAGGFVLQQSSGVANGNWSVVPNIITLANGQNQVTVTPSSGSQFYRLMLP